MDSTSELQSNVREYTDLDMKFTIHPIRKDLNKLTGVSAITNSIKNLLLTRHYERPFQPALGSNIRQMLFEPMDPITSKNIQVEIQTTLKNFEPRVSLLSIDVKPDYQRNGYNIILIFSIVNITIPIQINFFLERVR